MEVSFRSNLLRFEWSSQTFPGEWTYSIHNFLLVCSARRRRFSNEVRICYQFSPHCVAYLRNSTRTKSASARRGCAAKRGRRCEAVEEQRLGRSDHHDDQKEREGVHA